MIEINPYDTLFVGMVTLLACALWNKYLHRPIVWIIEDNPCDMALVKFHLKHDKYDVRYFESGKGIVNAFIKSMLTLSVPSAVITDYKLDAGIDGRNIKNFFSGNGIPTMLVTGYEDALLELGEKEVMQKSPDKSYYQKLEEWIYQVAM